MNLKLRIPPPFVAVICAGLIWFTGSLFPSLQISSSALQWIGFALICVGLSFDVICVLNFVRQKTTVNPMTPDRSAELVTTGLYRITRNPMYLGLLLILTGFAFYVGSALAIIVLAFFVWYITTFQIKPEEEALTKIFGSDFLAYQTKVRRWL